MLNMTIYRVIKFALKEPMLKRDFLNFIKIYSLKHAKEVLLLEI